MGPGLQERMALAAGTSRRGTPLPYPVKSAVTLAARPHGWRAPAGAPTRAGCGSSCTTVCPPTTTPRRHAAPIPRADGAPRVGGIPRVDLIEALRLLQAGRPPARTIGLTFDDGFADLAEHALPVLAEHGFRATVSSPPA